MSVRLQLRGPRPASSPAELADGIAGWLRELERDPRADVQRGEPALVLAELHPAAEPMELAVDDSAVTLRAHTGTAGPGFHRSVSSLAAAIGDRFGIAWVDVEDPTGWFRARDAVALERAFLAQLEDAAARVLDLARRGHRGAALSLPVSHAFEHDALVATPLGPRDEAWVRATKADPRCGVDAFPAWADEGTAAYYRGLALTRMWADVRWRPPIDPEERELLESIATWVERAHGLDPELALPWIEQSEILTFLGEESLRATRAHVKAQARGAGPGPRIGYRRRAVRVRLSGGWSMSIPGELAERWDERGTWVGWDAGRSIFFTSLTVHDDHGVPSPDAAATLAQLPALSDGEGLEMERGELRSVAVLVEDEQGGERIHRLEAHAAIGHHAAVGTAVFADPSDRAWALETWGSLDRSG